MAQVDVNAKVVQAQIVDYPKTENGGHTKAAGKKEGKGCIVQ